MVFAVLPNFITQFQMVIIVGANCFF